MSASRAAEALLLVGGLGAPHDRLAAAAIASARGGRRVDTWGALDERAFERGRASLPRGQCAPILYTTGALLRKLEHIEPGTALSLLSVRSCGPCRYALFEPAWQRAMAQAGHRDVQVVAVEQSLDALRTLVGDEGVSTLLDALLVADVLREVLHRLRPRVEDPDALEARAAATVERIAAAIESGASPVSALADEASFHVELTRRPPSALARVMLLGDPWSMHVHGDGQLNLPSVLARAGAEVEVPPFALWLSYVLWQTRAEPFGRGEPPTPSKVALARSLETELRARLRAACHAAGLGGFELPCMDELVDLASPHLSPAVRGGYGHVEVGLAVRARRERRAHLVVSIKSFGCIPSSGVSDAIVPTALEGAMPFLALEVSGDGEAARESRLMLRVASALERAAAELAAAELAAALPPAPDPAPAMTFDPLEGRFETGPRAFACTLACHVHHSARSAPVARLGARA